jgi:hypothetical protein
VNIFVLCTGRCGSVTFAKACAHITNFTSAHESRVNRLGDERLAYPDAHIEVDNRLSWFLGRLDEKYGDSAFYVHLTRDPEATAQSFNRRWHLRSSIMRAYAEQICMTSPKDPLAMCRDYVSTVNSNIRAFLKGKPKACHVRMEAIHQDFSRFWALSNAEGELTKALAEWATSYNKS